MKDMLRLLRDVVRTLCTLSVLAATIGCEATPAVTPGTTAPTVGTAPSTLVTAAPGTPVGPRAVETPTAAVPCTVPAFAEQLALTSLPGTVRDPIGLAALGGRLYVSGRVSNNLGVVEGDKLAQIVPLDFGPAQLVADEQHGRLYAVNGDQRAIALFEGPQLRASLVISNPLLASYQELGGIALDAPHERLYALMNGETSAIAVIDTRAFTITRWINLTGWRTATRMTLDPTGATLYLGGYNRIEVIDPVAGVELRAIPLPSPSYQVLVLDPVSGRLFVDQYENGAYIGVIENDNIVARIPVGTDVNDGLIAGRRLYVSAAYSSTVSVIDPQTLQTVATIPVGTGPRTLAADGSGSRVYVGIEGIYGRETNRVEVIDTQTNTVTKLIPLMGQPSQILADETRGRLYALMPSSSELLISDGRRVLSSVPLERSPAQMALDEAAGRLYVTDWQTGHVSIIDVVNGRLLEQRALMTPWRLNAVAVDSRNRQLVVNNRTYALDALTPSGYFTITGYTVPYGDGINPDRLLANPSAPRLYVVASNGVPGSNGGITLYSVDSQALQQLTITGERNVYGVALDDVSQRLYVAGTHPLAGGTNLFVYDAVSLTRTSVVPMFTRVTALALNPRTRHLFATYLDYQYAQVRPGPYSNQVDVLDVRTLGRVTTIPVGADPVALAVLGDRVFVAHASGRALTVLRDCAGPAPLPPTPTRTPTPYPTMPPPPTPPPTPTPSPTPRRTVAPTAPPTPAATCRVPIAAWVQTPANQTFDLRANMGCPIEPGRTVQFARQYFENGVMFWRADTRQIYVISSAGTWATYTDTWDESQPQGGAERPPRPDLYAPKRGFGKVWREQLGGPSAALGWGIEEERAVSGEIQPFESGQALRDGTGPVWLLIANGAWR